MDQMTMTYTSFTGYLRYAGGFSASLSSAIASLVGAPRVLQAVGKDKIYPGIFFFAKGYTANNDPFRGYILVFIVAFCFCMIAGLNMVSVIASNFFLAAYALMNLSCFHSSITKAPSWRPSYTWYNPWVSLFSTFLCIGMMFVLDWIWATVTFGVTFALGLYIFYTKPDANWGSSTQGQVFVSAVKAVHTLTETPDHVKNYRPKILVLTGNPAHRPALVDFANLITKKVSLLITAHIINDQSSVTLSTLKDNVEMWLRDHAIRGFYMVNQSTSFEEGAKNCIRMSGLGKLCPNMLLMGFKSDWRDKLEQSMEYINTMFCAFDQKMSVAILRVKDGFDYSATIAEEQQLQKVVAVGDDHSDDDEETAQHETSKDLSPLPLKTRKVSTAVYRGSDGHPLANKTVANIKMFQPKKRTGYIDVWWLYDDGGLTLLLPYILTTRKQFHGCKLRVFSLANRSDQLDHETRQMATLLSRFRIDYSDVIVIPDVTKKADPATKAEFDAIISGAKIDNEELQAQKEKTNRHLRLAELLRQYSNKDDTELIVMTLPLPKRGHTSPALYMAWLEIMTRNLPPILLTRGNQTSVLTFYS
jgi:solute carrier family 12 sodium/potassium/chloride transporter 2